MKFFILILTAFFAMLGVDMCAEETSNGQNIIILLGPPGSGKGTQAIQITKELGIPHISTGDLFRENIKNKTPLGEKAKTFMDAGQLVPDGVVLDMLFDRVSRPDCSKGYLLDGFPRTIPQAEALDRHLSHSNAHIIVFNLEVPDDVIIQRAAGRLTCKSCGHVHNKSFSPSKIEGECDKCHGELIQRDDDKPEVVKERLRVYHDQTKPLISFYQFKKLLTSFDGTQPPQKVFENIMKKYRELTHS